MTNEKILDAIGGINENDDIVGAAVYQYGDNIVVEFEGKYWLYEN